MAESLARYLASNALFTYLSTDDLQIIERFMFFNSVAPGEFVFKEGDRGDYVCFVVHGQLEVIKVNAQNQAVVITQLTNGASIGEMALIDRMTRSASIRATVPTGLVVLTRKGFDMILREHPEIGINILKGMASLLSMKLRKTSEKLAEFMEDY